MSRADYLAKYLSKGDEKKLKKKLKGSKSSKKSKQDHTQVIIGGLNPSSLTTNSNDQEEVSEDPFLAVEDEYAPTSVASVLAPKENKGFRRIDDGKVVEKKPASVEIEQPETIYRDLTGRKIDLQKRAEELKEEKELREKQDRAIKEKIGSGELDKLRQKEHDQKVDKAKRFDYSKENDEYVNHMNSIPRFEDPMSAFVGGNRTKVPSTTETGRPVYTKGLNPTNRFKIKAGYYWDGIDRSNGFEDRLVKKRSELHVEKFTSKAAAESYTEYDFD